MSRGWRGALVPVAVLLGAVALVLGTDAGLRPAAVVASSLVATAAPLLGLAAHRPARRWPWLLTTGMIAGWTASIITVAATGGPSALASGLLGAGQAVAGVLVGLLFSRGRHSGEPADPRGSSLGRRTDAGLLAVVLGLVVGQVVAAELGHPAGSRNWVMMVPALDALLAGLLLRFIASRARLRAGNLLLTSASLVTIVFDMLVTRTGHRTGTPGDPLELLWVLGAWLFTLGSVHRSMAAVFDPRTLQSRRTESARLLGLIPLVLLPPGLYWLQGPTDRLPPAVYLAAGTVVAALAIARGAQAVRTSEYRAQHDPLTGLANRRGLARAFDSLPPGGPAVLCLLDVDDFKAVNDTFGHEAGDDLLCTVGERLRAAVGGAGTIARSGGDEFVLLLPDGVPDPGRIIRDAFRAPFVVGDGPRAVSVSVGVAPVGPQARLAHVLADADIALYSVKEDGKAAVATYRPAMREAVLGRLALLADLRTVLAGEPGGGTLQVHFQPLVDLADGRVDGCEALVRWLHPTRGLIRPDLFLGLAEQHGLGARLDRWVLRTALDQLGRWDAAGHAELCLSVNLGRGSMLDPHLADGVLTALAGSGVSAGRLHLEITEHDELPPEAGRSALHRLAAGGVRISLDDFGVGYTSLDYLRRYPVHLLKLDLSITRPLRTEPTSPLVAGIVALAHSLGLAVLAEGIETEVQRDRLAALGIGFGQGYLFSRPTPAADAGWLTGPGRPLPAGLVRPRPAADGRPVDAAVRSGRPATR